MAAPIARCDSTIAGIVSGVGERTHSYAEMVGIFSRLQATGRVKVTTIGKSVQGRPIPLVALMHPETVFGTTPRLFIVARQHGTERASTEMCIALVSYLAQSSRPEDVDFLRRVTIVCVPMANPDGAEASRRCNANGADLNRNWDTCSQPETAAIAQAVKLWRPDAVMDLHELPAETTKESYRDNFMECVGKATALPAALCSFSAAVSGALSRAMAACGYPLHVYYDFPGEATNLCHRHFGLREGIPSFLFEAKTGGGRSMQYRVGFQTVAVMVVASSLINEPLAGTYRAPGMLIAGAREAVANAARSAIAAVSPAVPPTPAKTSLRVSLPETLRPSAAQRLEVSAAVQEGPDFAYVSFLVDGQVRALTNCAPFAYSLECKSLKEGRHQVCVQAVDSHGAVLDQKVCTLLIDNSQTAGE
jgi:hypothetical protein